MNKIPADLKVAALAAAFILTLFGVALTEPIGTATPDQSPAPTGSLVAPATSGPVVHWGIEPGKGFGKAR